MHKQHEDQPSNNLPNLSTWHSVPAGATIPTGAQSQWLNALDAFYGIIRPTRPRRAAR